MTIILIMIMKVMTLTMTDRLADYQEDDEND